MGVPLIARNGKRRGEPKDRGSRTELSTSLSNTAATRCRNAVLHRSPSTASQMEDDACRRVEQPADTTSQYPPCHDRRGPQTLRGSGSQAVTQTARTDPGRTSTGCRRPPLRLQVVRGQRPSARARRAAAGLTELERNGRRRLCRHLSSPLRLCVHPWDGVVAVDEGQAVEKLHPVQSVIGGRLRPHVLHTSTLG